MVGVTELLRSSLDAGLDLRIVGDRLVVRGPRRAEPLARQVLERKADVLSALDWYAIEERAAIYEYEAGLSREDAERRALLGFLKH